MQAGSIPPGIVQAALSASNCAESAGLFFPDCPSDRNQIFSPPKPATVAPDHATQRNAGQDAPGNAPDAVAHETAVRMAVMETELRALKEMVDELKQSRDDWQQQAERATIALAAPARPWWQRLAG